MNVPWKEWWPLLLDGAVVTLQVSVLSAIVALLIAAAVGLARVSRFMIVRGIAKIYVELFRSCSLLVLLFWTYFALPFIGIELSKLAAGVLAIGLNISAYGAEIVRSAIMAVPAGQREAAVALNLSDTQRMFRIVLPQAFARMLPPFGNLLIELVKSTSLVYFITLSDLTYQALILRNNFNSWTLLIFALLLVIYFLISSCVTLAIRLLERRITAWR
ncbi:ectoine/hydroxyectoine ABC transporter permease subunit EhuC [Paenibacillus sp. GCM10027626]|uniref:ectoine/hydroxyectoine ABC transporter permease subunit EhuC n=1 Tax=Paenibacillus sp. GCM10027626 TaxID=3273411 RepID=UPI00363AAC28